MTSEKDNHNLAIAELNREQRDLKFANKELQASVSEKKVTISAREDLIRKHMNKNKDLVSELAQKNQEIRELQQRLEKAEANQPKEQLFIEKTKVQSQPPAQPEPIAYTHITTPIKTKSALHLNQPPAGSFKDKQAEKAPALKDVSGKSTKVDRPNVKSVATQPKEAVQLETTSYIHVTTPIKPRATQSLYQTQPPTGFKGQSIAPKEASVEPNEAAYSKVEEQKNDPTSHTPSIQRVRQSLSRKFDALALTESSERQAVEISATLKQAAAVIRVPTPVPNRTRRNSSPALFKTQSRISGQAGAAPENVSAMSTPKKVEVAEPKVTRQDTPVRRKSLSTLPKFNTARSSNF